MPHEKLVPAEQLRLAFHWIGAQRDGKPELEVGPLVELAGTRYGLTPAQLSWVRWTLDPLSAAVQPKEPGR